MRILVVDDELAICELLDDFLSLQGYEVITAANGEDAIREFEGKQPQVVLLDIRMPGISGIDVLRRIKESDPETAVVMLSAFGDDNIIQQAYRLGADFYLQKPMELDQLSQLLTKWREES